MGKLEMKRISGFKVNGYNIEQLKMTLLVMYSLL